MAIQSRQGSYSDFDPNKMLPGEWACVRKGDPKAEDGRAVYMAFEPGVVKRMATHEDIVDQVKEAFGDAAEELAAEFTEEMRTATDNATASAKDAEQAAENANKAVEDANTATSNANDAADKANEAAEKAESAGVDIDYSEIEFDTEEIVVEGSGSGSGMELLWENSNPTSTFGAQTITPENMNKYKFLLFELRCYTNIANRFIGLASNSGVDTILSAQSTYANQAGGVIYRRDVNCNGNSVIFRNGYRQLGTTETQDDGYAIPVCIYGIK